MGAEQIHAPASFPSETKVPPADENLHQTFAAGHFSLLQRVDRKLTARNSFGCSEKTSAVKEHGQFLSDNVFYQKVVVRSNLVPKFYVGGVIVNL